MTEETVETRFAVHEAVCAERYEAIENRLKDGSRRMKNIEYLLYFVLATVLLGPGVAATLVKKVFGL